MSSVMIVSLQPEAVEAGADIPYGDGMALHAEQHG